MNRLVTISLLGALACTETAWSPQAPTIEYFSTTATTVELGTAVNLQARFKGGTGLITPGDLPMDTGSKVTVAPRETTTYTLTVTGPGGMARQEVTVTVPPALALEVQVHEGKAGLVAVAGPHGFARNLEASGVLTGIEAGEYTIQAAPVRAGSAKLHPWRPIQRVMVTTGTAVTVRYPAPRLTVALPGGIPTDFVLIPAGTFTMGEDHPAVPLRFPNPSPAHQVTLLQAFYMAEVPTTQAQWEAVLGSNPSRMKDPAYPVTDVSSELLTYPPENMSGLPGQAPWVETA